MSIIGSGVVTFERVLINILRDGYATVQGDPEFIDRVFQLIPQNERQELKDWIKDNEMDVSLGYPIPDSKFPCWRIVLTRDQMIDSFIGDFLEGQEVSEEFSPDDKPFVDEHGELYEQAYSIYTYTNNADLTNYMYHLLKLFMHTERGVLENSGFMDPSYAGNDLVRDSSLSPQIMYTRVFVVTGKAFFSTQVGYGKVEAAYLENVDFES
jgi:hypothetical protein